MPYQFKCMLGLQSTTTADPLPTLVQSGPRSAGAVVRILGPREDSPCPASAFAHFCYFGEWYQMEHSTLE